MYRIVNNSNHITIIGQTTLQPFEVKMLTTDTMRLAGAGTTGSRTLAANGIAQFRKITATEWLAIPMGTGLT